SELAPVGLALVASSLGRDHCRGVLWRALVASARKQKQRLNRIEIRVLSQSISRSRSKRDTGDGMTIIGYARVSTTGQDLGIQINALKAAGCEVIRSEKRSGTTTEGRAEQQTVLDFLRPGDVLMVTRIDRLARSIGDLQDIVRALKARGASLKATEQPIDTST